MYILEKVIVTCIYRVLNWSQMGEDEIITCIY